MTDDRQTLIGRALAIEWLLIVYNVIEMAAAETFGILAGSIALVGFGLDSFVEVSAASILVWRLRMERAGRPHEAAERKALRFVGITFFALAAYVGYRSIADLVAGEPPLPSLPGIVLAALSVVLMPFLGAWKLGIAKKLGSRALRADAMETIVCAYLSVALLAGLGLNALWGWWWADPAAALCMVPLMLKEGWEGVRGGEE